ncbi:hypothetical protein [Flavobacterium sp.]|uniref:hypothetical protein n=1 Tax=Flavobacterium sp. TaxID=239 RepID=UPI0039E261A1
MEKTRLLTLCVIGLILLNLGLLGFMFTRKHGPHHIRKRDIVIEKLHFDPKQVQQYDLLIATHQQQIRQIESKMHTVKNKLYLQLLGDHPNEKVKDSLIGVLADYQALAEQTHFNHFEGIRGLCRKDQMQDFYALTEELARLFSKPPGPPPHER